MKSELKLSTRGFKNITDYANALWNKYQKSLSTDGEGERITKQYMIAQMQIRYQEALDEHPGITKSQALKLTAKKYQISSDYFSQEERVANFSIKDFIQTTDPEEIRRFQSLTRDKGGRYAKFDPNKVQYVYSGKIDGQRYTISRYLNVVKLTFNSPESVYFFAKNQIPQEFQMYFTGVNLD